MNDDFRKQLQKYNWSSDKDYQLAVIAFKDILPTYTAKKELEARIDELNQFYDYWNNRKDIRNIDTYKNDRITQLSSQLTNNKEGIEK